MYTVLYANHAILCEKQAHTTNTAADVAATHIR